MAFEAPEVPVTRLKQEKTERSELNMNTVFKKLQTQSGNIGRMLNLEGAEVWVNKGGQDVLDVEKLKSYLKTYNKKGV